MESCTLGKGGKKNLTDSSESGRPFWMLGKDEPELLFWITGKQPRKGSRVVASSAHRTSKREGVDNDGCLVWTASTNREAVPGEAGTLEFDHFQGLSLLPPMARSQTTSLSLSHHGFKIKHICDLPRLSQRQRCKASTFSEVPRWKDLGVSSVGDAESGTIQSFQLVSCYNQKGS